MAKKRATNAPQQPEHPVQPQLEKMTDTLVCLLEAIDNLREDFQWAVQNGRIIVQMHDEQRQHIGSTIPLFTEGDAVRFWHNGREYEGEVTTVNDAENTARVHLFQADEEVTARQDDLTTIDPDPLRRQATESIPSEATPPTAAPQQSPQTRTTGSLF
ncbi:hypothetical protein [Calycomorphotria hydatis]|nr:hypothetical protein [Calycomorphotria hydatis]